MIKSWSKFNESSNELRGQLAEKLLEVRDVFADFEDMGIISYGIITSGYERGSYGQFNPKEAREGDFERFLDFIIPTIQIGLTRGNIGAVSRYKTTDEDYCIITDIKLPAKPTEFGSTLLGNEGIKIFEDILVANSRLIDAGYNVKLDLNASHNAYKPLKFLIYFNL